MPFVGVFDHRDLELSWQADDRRRRQEGERDPARLEAVGEAVQRLQVLSLRSLGVEVAQPVMQPEQREQGHRRQAQHLDDRFKRDCRDHAGMAFIGAEIAGAKQDDEGRHAHGNPEAGVGKQSPAARVARLPALGGAEGVETCRHRLQLQRDVGGDADQRNDRDQRRDRGALAIARRNEVGDRGDVLILADAHQLAQQEVPSNQRQGRPQIDGQIFKSVACRRSDRAVEGPGCAIDRQ